MSRPLVSVVAVTRDRPEPMLRCARSIVANDYRPLELVIVDNGTAESRETLARGLAGLGDDVEVRHVTVEPVGFGALRRRAVAETRGELLLSIDDDCLADPHAIEAAVEAFERDRTLGILGGAIDNVGFEGRDRFKGRGRLGVNARWEIVEDPSRAEVFGSANQTIRREAYDAAGGYDPFFRDGLEEADLALAVRRAGYRISFSPDVKIEHRHCPSRFRARWQNLNAMRLYLFFKHRPPRGLHGWAGFGLAELRLWLGDIRRECGRVGRRARAYGGGVAPVRVARGGAAALFEIFKATLARLQVPWLYRRARRATAPAAGAPVEAGT